MKRLLMVAAVVCAAAGVWAEPTITGVTARQRYPWNGKVDISYTVENVGTESRELAVWAIDQTTGITNVAKTVTGETAYASGKHHIVWDMSADGLTLVSTNVVFAVAYVGSPLYCVIDLSGGTSASPYPVSYLPDVPAGGWSDEYKTTKLVLRKVKAGVFTMGGRSTDYPDASDHGLHQVTLTKDYWMGVFQLTQRQWELVMGTRPSYFNNSTCYASRPVEQVSYNMIRGSSAGAGWPNSSAVDATSFLGVLREKSGLTLDLPTEAQWEYACRAGTTTALNSGKNLTSTDQDAEMDKVGRYWYNGGSGYSQSCDTSAATAKVGSYAPNAWGLYDMHGNVWEWCLDWRGSYSGDATDPKGSSSGSYRVLRGGSWGFGAYGCCSAYPGGDIPSLDTNISFGFRLVRTLSEPAAAETAATSGASVPVRIDLTTGMRTAAATEMLTYSTEWDEVGAGAVAVVAVDGVTIGEASGSGIIQWTPVSLGKAHTMTHTVLVGGEPVGEMLTATFRVPGMDITEEEIEWWLYFDVAQEFKKSGETAIGYVNRFKERFGDDYTTAFYSETGKTGQDGEALCVYHDYIAGTDPLDKNSLFKADIDFDASGKPVVTYKPVLSAEKTAARIYTTHGKQNLKDGWSVVEPGQEADYRFFKVTIQMRPKN